jgi:hypothetical protein
VPGSHLFDNAPDGLREIAPLIVMICGIAIPVALVTLAASGGATIVLILAIIAMFAVGGATMAFMGFIMSDPDEHSEDAEAPAHE